jgi:DNA-directed RNA polymerase specialized sigma24 family protein
MDEAGKMVASSEGAAHPEARMSWPRRRGGLDVSRVAELLDAWRTGELERFTQEWRTLSYAELEDLYSETTIPLLARPYRNEGKLRIALREGMQYRALTAYNAALRHREIIAESEQGMSALLSARSAEETPEKLALARQDELLLNELVRELTPFQRQVFEYASRGQKYKKIATTLGVPAAQARSATRACQSKGKTFLRLYESGRLCGYRTETIKAIQQGRSTSEQLAELAIAHLESCPQCRAEHRTNGARLRSRFNEQATALMPPALIMRWSLFTQSSRGRALTRFLPDTTAGREVLRERAGTLIATGGVGAKLAVTALLSVAVVAGGIGASHVLEHHPPVHAKHHAPVVSPRGIEAEDQAGSFYRPQAQTRASTSTRRTQHGRARHYAPLHSTASSRESGSGGQSEPGGFGQPGIVVEAPKPAPVPEPSTPEEQRGGGPFSP